MVGRTVQRVFSDRGFCYYQSRWVFIATWHNVSRYTSITARNTVRVNCQLISSKVAFSEPMSVAWHMFYSQIQCLYITITSLQNCNSIICRSDNQIGVAFAAVATALHCERSCVSVRDMTLSKEMWSSQLVLGRPPDDSRKGRGCPSPDAQQTVTSHLNLLLTYFTVFFNIVLVLNLSNMPIQLLRFNTKIVLKTVE